MTIYLTELSDTDYSFPSPFEALEEPNGLLAFGGDLSPSRLLSAYQQGVFPWFGPNEPLLWWSPAPRAIFDPQTYTPSRSLKKFQRKTRYRVTLNMSTPEVIHYCASTRPVEETWLNEDMQNAYIELAQQGHCHSIEVWDEHRLIGGLYGLSIGQVFCGESMFSLATNASKIALWYFCRHFCANGGRMIDCQVMNPHLESLGAKEISRESFIEKLHSYRQKPVHTSCFVPQELSFATEMERSK
ncbi:leucyl/phenylalanyl-tRNA--protein transferase [Vibrio hangzhouensis]|uniref:Leucyl/phenylalanyl-tRNA--protein transferase n=1 Tax=Vibrio hangzhouensis TaxID=462991 RepID=A0A1H5YW36_9VIBR|nr:leucyl/phenylalanyl-tRNA--protein transferase [Vibrio hangzhouensis]SEG28483.1 leucyl/phenylalanyl-tRNA--protein transferase [Vibrio hangzhouensis]